MKTTNPRKKVRFNSEIEEYATYLGLDLEDDSDLLYIAREGLKAPLPAPWKPCQTKNKDIFYFNFETQESVWEHPCDRYYKEKVKELKSGKAKRKGGDQRPVRTPPSVGKSAPNLPSKMTDLKAAKTSGPFNDKLQVELDAFKQELEGEKDMVRERNEMQLEEYKKDLKTQLNNEEQTLRRGFETEKERNWAERRKTLGAKTALEEETFRTAKTQRLETLKNALDSELEHERARLDFEEKKQVQAILETETKRGEEELQRQHKDLDGQLSALQRETQSQQEKERTEVEEAKKAVGQAEILLQKELARIQVTKETRIREESAQEQIRFESELSALHTSLDQRLRDLDHSDFTSNSPEDLSLKETRLREEADLALQSAFESLRRKNQDRLQAFRKECEQKLEEDRNHQRQEQARHHLAQLDEERKLIDFNARQDVLAFQRTLTLQLDSEKRKLDAEWKGKMESLRTRSDFHISTSDSAEELELDGQVRRLTQDLSQLQETARKKQGLLERSRTAHEAAVLELSKAREEKRRFNRPQERPNSTGPEVQERVTKMEREVQELKRMVLDPVQDQVRPSTAKATQDPVHKWRSTLQKEKQEIKEFIQVLEQEKRLWTSDWATYKDHPNPERKTELVAVRKVLDQQIGRLNDRIKELKLAENWIRKQESGEPSFDEDFRESKPEDFALDYEEEVLAKWKFARETPQERVPEWRHAVPVQPLVDHKMHVYQRFLSREANQREQLHTMFSRQNNWISNMKEEVRTR